MPLKLRRPVSAPASAKTARDYTVSSGEWDVGRIYETRQPRQPALVLVASGGGDKECAYI